MNETVKKFLPTVAAISASVVIAATLSHPSTQPVHDAKELPAQTKRQDGIETRLVSCGGRGAKITGDGKHSTDYVGVVSLGFAPMSTCTVVYEALSQKNCTIVGGRLAKSLPTEFVVDQIDGTVFTYRCE